MLRAEPTLSHINILLFSAANGEKKTNSFTCSIIVLYNYYYDIIGSHLLAWLLYHLYIYIRHKIQLSCYNYIF